MMAAPLTECELSFEADSVVDGDDGKSIAARRAKNLSSVILGW